MRSLPGGRSSSARASWAGVAFIVEAMLLLVFLIGSLALFSNLFASAVQRGQESREITAAVAAATDTAERFAADPASLPARIQKGNLIVACEVAGEPRAAGTLYRADITVYGEGAKPVYSIATAVYESGAGR